MGTKQHPRRIGEGKRQRGWKTYPFALSPKATHALVRTRPTVCVALTLNLFSFSVGGCRITINNLSVRGAGAGARAGAISSLCWGLGFDCAEESVPVKDAHGSTSRAPTNDLEELID